jgi:cytochrome c biogenesis protein
MQVLKKIFRFIASMKFAILLLAVIAIACVIGSLVVENVFHSWWFITLVSLLCLSLLFCNLFRVRALIRQTKDAADPEHALNSEPTASASGVSDPEAVMKRLRFFRPLKTASDGRDALFAYRNRIGFWGAWICHVGIILIVLGYALGQMMLFETRVYGVPGDSIPIEGTDVVLTIDGFSIERSDDGFIKQYETALTLTDADGNAQSGTSGVNHPAVLLGYKIYQHATGSVTDVTFFVDGEPVETERVYVGDTLSIPSIPGLVFVLDQFDSTQGAFSIPRYVNGERAPWKYDTVLPGDLIDLSPFPYALSLSEPVDTLLRVKRDPFSWLVLAGAILTTLGLFFALYVVPETVWAVREEDGSWTVYGRSKKLAPLFKEQFERAVSGRKGKGAER